MALAEPLMALGVSFIFLVVALYKRVSIGVTLTLTSVVLGLLSMSPLEFTDNLLYTTTELTTVSLVLVTFGIMLLSQLYNETNALDSLSRSFGAILKNPKLVVSALPAVLGLLPVPGGALMSAPLVEAEAERLALKKSEKAYVNVWFRHIIFPVYPMSQVLILATTLTGVSIVSLVVAQIPVVVVMVLLGYFLVLRKVQVSGHKAQDTSVRNNLRAFLLSFSPILVMILALVILGIDVAAAAFLGIAFLLLITRPGYHLVVKTLRKGAIYKTALAAYGAMLLRNTAMASGAATALGHFFVIGNMDDVLLLVVLPLVLAFLIGSPTGSIALSVPILAGVISFRPSSASLLYISAYFGYLIAPTHLCLVLTADYFKCPLDKVYGLLIPSIVASFSIALLVYFLL